MVDFAARRAEILAHLQSTEKERGSGWHPGDPGAEIRDRKGEPALSERLIAMQHDDVIHLVGPCVEKVKTAIRGFFTKLEAARQKAKEKGWKAPNLLNVGEADGYQRQAVKCAEKALALDEIALSTQEWNYVNAILEYMHVFVTMSTAEVESYD